jgi:cytochrome c-type biogenesis protein CcmH
MFALCPHPKRHPGGGRDPVHVSVAILVVTALVALFCVLSPARAVEPGEMLKDPALEARARRISQELRCLVCQNQSIDDSNAELARDLRVLVRERLAAGDSDAAVLAFVEARYGEFVLLRPPLKLHTLALWSAPILLLLGIAIYLVRRTRSQRLRSGDTKQQPAELSPSEQQRLAALLRARDESAQRQS